MKPGNYRGASAIYYVHKQRGILMDCAEGSYGQLFDHLGSEERTSDALLKTKVVFITHMHGDHQLGILKILHERDNLINEETKKFGKIYAVIPSPLHDYF
jgi:ribonuclease Z